MSTLPIGRRQLPHGGHLDVDAIEVNLFNLINNLSDDWFIEELRGTRSSLSLSPFTRLILVPNYRFVYEEVSTHYT